MNTKLVKYEAACLALAECKFVDEVKSWADKAAAMQAYGRMAKDKTLEVDASEIRIRAERRLGELLLAQKAAGGLNPASTLKRGPVVVGNDHGESATLSDADISKDLSSRSQKLAAVPADVFEGELAAKRDRELKDGERVSARLLKVGAKVLRDAAPEPEPEGPSPQEIADAERTAEDDAETVRILLESDDKLAAMTAKCKQQAAQIRILESRVAGLVNQVADQIRSIKSLHRQLETRKAA